MDCPNIPYRIFPLGDAAVTIDFGNVIDEAINQQVLALFNQFRNNPLPAMIEVIPAYSSLTVCYDLFNASKMVANGKTVYDFMSGHIQERMKLPLSIATTDEKIVTIPVCYDDEFAPDIENLAKQKNISVSELITIHASRRYRVYMLGFIPGFTYMGKVEQKIAIPRKSQPVMVEAGSVGIAGMQTGIYPFASPGGWYVIGRTPLKLFDIEKEEPVLLKPGDSVQFVSISKDEFKNY